MHQNCTPTKTGRGRQANVRRQNQSWQRPCDKTQHRLQNAGPSRPHNHFPAIALLPLQTLAKEDTFHTQSSQCKAGKKKKDREGRRGVVQTGMAAFIGPSSNLVKKPIKSADKNVSFVTPRKLFPLLTFSSFIYTNKNLLHPVLKCLSIYRFAPRAFEKEQRTGGAPKIKEKLGNLKRRRSGGRREPETKGSMRCLRRRAPKQALYKHLQRVPHHS